MLLPGFGVSIFCSTLSWSKGDSQVVPTSGVASLQGGACLESRLTLTQVALRSSDGLMWGEGKGKTPPDCGLLKATLMRLTIVNNDNLVSTPSS